MTDPVGYDVVKQHMMHGPCGVLDPKCSCMVDNRCSKHFPKKFNAMTTLDDDGFPVYRRREDGRTVEKTTHNKTHLLDNRYVVPYNRALLVKYRAHINVEICNRSRAIKYLFKYIHKGPDRAHFVFSSTNGNDSQSTSAGQNDVDEITQYVNARYLGASEACWRIFEFDMFVRQPAVERLTLHMPEQQPVQFRENDDIAVVLARPNIEKTMLTEWMETNKKDLSARQLTYPEFPRYWVWDKPSKNWHQRKMGDCIGRMYYIPPATGEIFYLRQLLNVQKGCQNFADIRTVNGVLHTTYKEACFALGLLEDDKEWNDALTEATAWAMPSQLRQLFATILAYCEVIKPSALWEAHWKSLAEDIQHRERACLKIPDLKVSDDKKQSVCLFEIDNLLRQCGRKLSQFKGMPQPKASHLKEVSNRLLAEETRYNNAALREEYTTLKAKLNVDQRRIHDSILHSINTNAGQVFFVSGYGGTGKTFLWKTLLAKVRSEGKIALAVASSGIAALLIPGGRTAHSRFHIPLEISRESTCSIKRGSDLGKLLLKTSLIIWDEAPMANKFNIEAVDKSLRDILAQQNNENSDRPFGGITTVLGGDFRQTLPIIKKGTREETVNSSFKMSSLWQSCQVFNLTHNMRLDNPNVSQAEQREIANFSDWILQIGNGDMCNESGEGWIRIPMELLLEDSSDPVHSIV